MTFSIIHLIFPHNSKLNLYKEPIVVEKYDAVDIDECNGCCRAIFYYFLCSVQTIFKVQVSICLLCCLQKTKMVTKRNCRISSFNVPLANSLHCKPLADENFVTIMIYV